MQPLLSYFRKQPPPPLGTCILLLFRFVSSFLSFSCLFVSSLRVKVLAENTFWQQNRQRIMGRMSHAVTEWGFQMISSSKPFCVHNAATSASN